MSRPLCKNCKMTPAAVNYHGKEKIYYRSLCEQCISKKANPEKINVPSWRKSGYKKKSHCEQCGFKTCSDKKIAHLQMTVLYMDRDLRNNNWINLKTICSNCAIEISVTDAKLNPNKIKPDF